MSITVQYTLESLTCYLCGIHFAVPGWWETERRADHKNFYCPNGHSQHFLGKSDRDKLVETEEQRNLARMERDRLRAELAAKTASLSRANKKAKKMRERIAAGVCPCCTRSFTNLQRHMKTQHPDFTA